MNLLGTKTTIATSLFSLILSLAIILFYLDKTTNSWTAFYKLLLPVLGIFSVATFLVVTARATMVTWITVLVLLAFAGNRRRVLVQQGRKITADVAMFFIKALTPESSPSVAELMDVIAAAVAAAVFAAGVAVDGVVLRKSDGEKSCELLLLVVKSLHHSIFVRGRS